MTKIRMDWGSMLLTAEGHAGGGPKGKDVVCAGISALTLALLNQLMATEGANATYTIAEKDGFIVIRSEPDERAKDKVRNYYEVIMTGLAGWRQAYPENVRIEEVNRNGTA